MSTRVINVSKKLSRNGQNGAVAIIVAISLPILIGMAGLALDLGKLYITKTELQNATDACALAAAVELDGTESQFAKAESAGIAVGQLNKSYFQSAVVKFALNDAIKFSQQLNGTYLTKTSALGTGKSSDYQFVQCSANHINIPNYLVPVLNVLGSTVADSSDVVAAAVASNRPGQSTCAIPIGLCSTQVSDTTPVGTWLEGIQTAQGSNQDDGSFSGYFKWVDFTEGGGGARELKDVLAGNKDCKTNILDPNAGVGEFGLKGGAEASYNTRFGLYAQGAKRGVPDKSGYAYNKFSFPNAFNAYSDFIANVRPQNLAYQGDEFTKLNTQPGLKETLTASELFNEGTNRRISVAPVIDCDTKKIQRYACIFLLHPMSTGNVDTVDADKMYIEYLGNAQDAAPCNQSGIAGASNGIGPRVSALVQ